MMRILCLLMPYSGHFYPNKPLLELFAAKQAQVLVFCDERYQKDVPFAGIEVRNYPEEIRKYCSYMTSFTKDRKAAAREYFSYIADSSVAVRKKRQEEELTVRTADLMRQSLTEFSPDIVLYDAQAFFAERIAKEMSCPCFELNASTILPELWSSASFREYYQDIVSPVYPEPVSYDQILGLQRKLAGKSGKKPHTSFAYISPSLQDEYELRPGHSKAVGFRGEAVRAECREGIYITRGTVCESYGAFLLYDTVQVFRDTMVPIDVSCGNSDYVKGVMEEAEFPGHIRLHAYTNQLERLAKCRVFITHGGITGVREAIFANTPMLVIPTNFPDYQTGLALERHHGGFLIRKRPLDREELLTRYEEIISHYDEYQAGVKSLAAELLERWEQYGAEEIWKECEQIL